MNKSQQWHHLTIARDHLMLVEEEVRDTESWIKILNLIADVEETRDKLEKELDRGSLQFKNY
jgi:hypothetical protein